MPVHVRKRGAVYRVCEPSGRIAMTDNKKPRDGGGHLSRERADRQARAINAGLKRKGKI